MEEPISKDRFTPETVSAVKSSPSPEKGTWCDQMMSADRVRVQSTSKKDSPNESRPTVDDPKEIAPRDSVRQKAKAKHCTPSAEKPSQPTASTDRAKNKTSTGKTRGPKRSAKAPKRARGAVPPKKIPRKRTHAIAVNSVKSPRRSKRLKEGNRVEYMAAQAYGVCHLPEAGASPNKATHEDECTLSSAAAVEDASDAAQSSAMRRSPSDNTGKAIEPEDAGEEGFDALLGTSVAVPAETRREDGFVGLYEREGSPSGMQSLSSLLPFGGFRRRKGRTASKKRSKKSSFDFSFFD